VSFFTWRWTTNSSPGRWLLVIEASISAAFVPSAAAHGRGFGNLEVSASWASERTPW